MHLGSRRHCQWPAPWFTKFAGSVHDRRWLKTVKDIYDRHHGAEHYLRNERPLARVVVVYSQQTAAFYGRADAEGRVEDHTLGMYQALVETRIPFEMVHDRLLDLEHIGQFKLLMPNVAALSDEQCEQLRRFVQQGGSLLATYETSLYDENGEQRQNFGLADLFGVQFKGRMPGPMKNSYLRLERAPAPAADHPRSAGFEETDRIINGLYWLEVESATPRRAITVDVDTALSGSPDGDGLSTRSPDRDRRRLFAPAGRKPHCLFPLGYRSSVLGGIVCRPRHAAGERD